MGVRRKPTEMLVNPRGGRNRKLNVVIPEAREAPEIPLPVGDTAREVWERFFTSPVSAAVDINADWGKLRRWIYYVDRIEKLTMLADADPIVRGSMGQPVENPLYRRIDRMEAFRLKIEERFGTDPLARFRLQLTFTEAKRSANDLRRELMRPVRPENQIEADVIDLEALE